MKANGQWVVATTEWRGVFFGKLVSYDVGRRYLVLEQCRNILKWGGRAGWLRLATDGPIAEDKIGPPVPKFSMPGVTSVAEVSPGAVEQWEKL